MDETELVLQYRKQYGLEDRADLSTLNDLENYFTKQNNDLNTQKAIVNNRLLPDLGFTPLEKPPKLNFTPDTKLAWEGGKLDNLSKDQLDTLLAKKQISNLNSQDFLDTSKKHNVPLGMMLNIAQTDGITSKESDKTNLSKKNLDLLGKIIKDKYLPKELFDIQSVSKAQKNPEIYQDQLTKNYQDLIDTLNA